MARGRRSTPALPLHQEIQRQGIVTMLHDQSIPGSSNLREEFTNWLQAHEGLTFQQLSQQFAIFKIQTETGDHGD